MNVCEEIISFPNLYLSWEEFIRGKAQKPDVADLALHLGANIYELHQELKEKTHIHSAYKASSIHDPKPRSIHKAEVRDRLLHHAITRVLSPLLGPLFIHDSYSSRKGKGTHAALERFREFGWKVSRNNRCTCWVLKCDIRKFFANIDHKILKTILARHIADKETLWLLAKVIDSFHSDGKTDLGLPLGNLTSQLLVNVYMNEFDQWIKHTLKAKYYLRYADDFVILSHDRSQLASILPQIGEFLKEHLALDLHPTKVEIKTLASGVDFLGWVHFPDHRVLRTATKRRMMRRLAERPSPETLASYRGMLGWGNTRKVSVLVNDRGFVSRGVKW